MEESSHFASLKKTNLNPDVHSNYRPISVLSVFSKVIEKHVHSCTSDFLESNNILHQTQSGFLSNFSTETALLEITESIKESLDNGGKAMLVLLDLSAEFDTVPRSWLLIRLQEIGLRGTVLKWYESFLSGRQQSVWAPPFSAPIPSMDVGVLQGSILSPTPFNIYLSPLAGIAESFGAQIITYADDTQLLFTCDKGTDFAGEDIKNCLSAVFSWFQMNQLKCNSDKSEVIFFGCPPDVNWKMWWPSDMHPPTSATTSAKNVSVKIDSSLSFKPHVLTLVGQCFGLLKALRKFLPLLSITHRKTIVQALIGSKLDYANVVYLGLPEYLLTRLQTVQNSAARAIFGLSSRSHSSNLLWALHWLPIRKRIQFKMLTMAFKSLHCLRFGGRRPTWG